MKRCLYQLAGVAFFILFFAGCEKADDPINEVNSDLEKSALEALETNNKIKEENLPDYLAEQLESYESKLINNYLVTFTGRTIEGAGDNVTTTFNYMVSSTSGIPHFDSFHLEIPDCAGKPLSWTRNSFPVSENEIGWNGSLSSTGSWHYSVSFQGEIPFGLIDATVIRGSNVETDKVIGPCSGVYSLSGSIFIDADEDNIKDASETGIPTIPVNLFDKAGDKVATVPTTADGLFSFMVLQGDYSIAVREDLLMDANFMLVGNNSVSLQDVRENLEGFNFGFAVNSSKVIQELENRVIPLNTEPTKFWVQQIRNAGTENSQYSKKQIREFLNKIEKDLLLPGPFYLGRNKEKSALDILTRPLNSDFEEFLQQLLTAELNVASGRGAILQTSFNYGPNSNFNSALLIYSEAVACRESGHCSDQELRKFETKAVSSNDTRMLLAFNGSGGIN